MWPSSSITLYSLVGHPRFHTVSTITHFFTIIFNVPCNYKFVLHTITQAYILSLVQTQSRANHVGTTTEIGESRRVGSMSIEATTPRACEIQIYINGSILQNSFVLRHIFSEYASLMVEVSVKTLRSRLGVRVSRQV